MRSASFPASTAPSVTSLVFGCWCTTRALLALLLVLCLPVPGSASSEENGAAGEAPADTVAAAAGEESPSPPEARGVRLPAQRVVVADSADLGPEMEAASTVLQGQEMQEIRAISRHRGDVGQLNLWDTPWHQLVLFHPGIAIPLETREGREKRRAAAREGSPAPAEEEDLPAGETEPRAPAAGAGTAGQQAAPRR